MIDDVFVGGVAGEPNCQRIRIWAQGPNRRTFSINGKGHIASLPVSVLPRWIDPLHGDFLTGLVGDAALAVVVVSAFSVGGGAGVVTPDLIAQRPGNLFGWGEQTESWFIWVRDCLDRGLGCCLDRRSKAKEIKALW